MGSLKLKFSYNKEEARIGLTRGKMGANRFFVLSTFLVLMFGFTLSLPTVDDGDSEHVSGEGPSRITKDLGPASNGIPEGLFTRFRRSPQFDVEIQYDPTVDRASSNCRQLCYNTHENAFVCRQCTVVSLSSTRKRICFTR